MRAMPASRERMLGFLFNIDDVDFAFPETKRGLERFDQARAIFFRDRDPILNDLYPRAETFDLRRVVNAENFVVDPHPEIALLLKKLEKLSRLRFGRNGDPQCAENV